MIKVRFESCDGGRWTKSFKTRAGAVKAITYQLGALELGSDYAVASDGIVTARVSGTDEHGGDVSIRTLLFPHR